MQTLALLSAKFHRLVQTISRWFQITADNRPMMAPVHCCLSTGRSIGLRRLVLRNYTHGLAWACVMSLGFGVHAAEFEPPAIAITKGTVVTAPGEQIPGGTVVVRDGLIVAVGLDVPLPPDAEVIEVPGHMVYAGFIDAGISKFLNPDRAAQPATAVPVDVRRYALAATRVDNRKSLTPEYSAAENLKLDGDGLEKRRQQGFTLLHVVPHGRLASGRGALITTRGVTVRESLVQPDVTAQFRVFAPLDEGYPHTLMGGTAHLRQFFLDARHYARHQALFRAGTPGIARPFQDATLDGIQPVLDRQIPAWFYAQTRDEIHRALNFSQEHEVGLTLWGGHEADACLSRLTERELRVVLTLDYGNQPKIEVPTDPQALRAEVTEPRRVQQERLERWQAKVNIPQKLKTAGLRFAASSLGLNEPQEFWTAIRLWIQNGLPRDAALAAVTSDAAEILGQSQRLGTLTPGKLAHLVVMTGPFDDERSRVRYVLIDGRKFEYHKDAQPVPGDSTSPALQLAGQWAVQIESAEGPVNCELALTQTGNRLNGTFKSPQGDGKLISGTVEGTRAEWVIAIGAGDREVALKFSVTDLLPTATVIKGTLKSAFGAAAPFSAERQSANNTPHAPNAVALGGIEPEPAPPPAPAAVPNSDLPVELPADRLQRGLKTGGNVLIQNGTVLTGKGETLPGTSILIQSGKIAAIGKDLTAPEGTSTIDASGKFVMPGIIDTHSHIMIGDGLGGVNEATLSIVPEVRVKDSVWTTDISAYRALAGGVTTARLFHGSANVIGGQDAVVKLKYGEPAHVQIIADAPQGVKFALGENVKFQRERFPNTRMGVEATLNRAFVEALDYRRQWMEYRNAVQAAGDKADQLLAPRRDLRLEALMEIVEQQKFIHSHCYRADEILMLLRVASGFGIRVWSLQHVLEGYKVAPEIAAHGASCSTFADWWAYKVEAYDATPFNAALLHQAGINTVIKSDDWELIRHLYLEAAKTVRYGGLTPDQALQTVTLNSARELGLSDRIGSLEVGKDGDVGIYNGHPLHAFSRCEWTLVEGEVYFQRAVQPTAMSVEASARLQSVGDLALPAPEIRQQVLELDETPAGKYALVGATLHPVESPDIPNGTLLVADGKITALGANVPIPADAKVVHLDGLHLYPGLIDSGTTAGLTEISKVRETSDFAESGDFQPDLRAGVAINPDSELIPVARAGGITTVLSMPRGPIISGQASLVKLGGWTVPDMVLELEAGLVVRWPTIDEPERRNQREREEDEKKRLKQIEQLKEFLQQGRLYNKLKADAVAAQQTPPVADPRYDALRPYLAGEKRVFVEAHQQREIAEALLWADAEKLKITVTGGTDAWKLAAELKSREIPVIIGPVMTRPTNDYDPFDAPYANPGRLFEAGVLFAIRSDDPSNSRNTPFEAAQAVAYGLPAEEALKSVTLNAAKVLGVESQIGSLSAGKLANLVITDGNPLLHVTQIKGTFIAGRPYTPETRQTRFYEKYRQRLTPKVNAK